MHLNIWKSVILSWANALEVVPTTFNFIGDLSPQFFTKLCSHLKGVDVSTMQDAVSYITDIYKSLILGNKEEDNYETLLATAYLLFTSVHQTNDELCKRLCCVPNREQAQIKSVLEAFVEVQPSKITKELLFMTLAKLPEGPESCGNSPYLSSPSSSSPNNGTPGIDDDTPHRQRRRSSRFKKVKHQLRMTMTLKNSLQEELDCAREIISNLESLVSVQNQDIAKLKEQRQHLVNEREPDVSWSSSVCKTPVSAGHDCVKCKSLERQISSYEEDALQDKSEIQGLNEALAALTKKISKVESEKRTLDDQLQWCEDKIMQNNNEISTLQNHLQDFMTHKKELECIIEELREARSAANCSVEEDIPNNLGNEVIDLQLSEMRLSLEEKDRIIYEKGESITHLNNKLEEKKSENQLIASELQKVVIQKKVVEDGLRTSEEKLVELNHSIFDLRKQLKHDRASHEAALEDYKKIIRERDLTISSYQSTLELEAIKQKEFENRCMELEKTVSAKEVIISSLEQKVQYAEESLLQKVEINACLEEQCTNLQSTLSEKKVDISALENEISHNKSLVQGMQKENELCQMKILTLDSNVKKMICDYEQVTSQLLKVTKEKENIEHQLQESQLYNAAVTEELENRESELQRVKMLCEESENLLLLKEETISSLEKEVAHCTEVVHRENEKNANLLQEIQTNQLEVSRLENALQKHQQEIEHCDMIKQEVERENIQFKGIIDALEAEVLMLTNYKQVADSELQGIVEEKRNIEEHLRTTEDNFVKLKELVDDLRKQLDQNKIQLKCALEDNEKIITERTQMISTYQSSLKVETDKLEEYGKRCKGLEKTVANYKEIIGTLEQDVKNAKDSLQQELDAHATIKEECATLQSTLAEKNAIISSLEITVLQNQSLIQEMEQNNELCQAKILCLDNSVEKLTSDYEQTTSQLSEIKKENEVVASQLQESQLRIETLYDDLEMKIQHMQEWKTRCKQQEDVLLVKSEKLSLLECEVVSLKEVMGLVNEKNETLLQSIETNQLEVTRLETELENTLKELEHYKLINQEIELENSKNKKSIDSLGAKILVLTSTNQMNTSELQNLIEQKKCVEERLRTTEENKVELDELVDDLRKQLDEHKIQLKAAIEEREKIITERAQIISTYQSSLKVETDKLEEYGKWCNDLEKTVANDKEIIGSLEQDVKNAKDLLQQELDAHATLKEECETLQSTLAEKNAVISSLEINVLQNQSLIQELEQKNELCQAKILRLDHSVEKLTSDYEQTTSQLSEIKKENEVVASQLQESQLRIATLCDDLEMKIKDLQECKMLCKEQENVLLVKNEKLSLLEGEVVSLTGLVNEKNETLLQNIETNQLEATRLGTELENTLKELEHYKLINQEIELENSKHKESIDSLGAEILMLTSTNQMKTSELQNLVEQKKCVEEHLRTTEEYKVELEELVDDLRKQLDEHKIQLKAAIEDKENIITERTQMISRYQSSLRLETDKLEEYKKRCVDLEKTIATNKDEFNALEQEVKHTEKSLLLKEELNATLKEECETLQSTLAESRAAISTLENEILQNDSAIQEKQQENELCQVKILTLNGTIMKLSSDFELATSQLLEITKQKEDAERQLQESHLRIGRVSEQLEQQGNELQKMEILCKEQNDMLLLKDEKVFSLEGEVVRFTEIVQQEHKKNETLLQEVTKHKLEVTRLETAVSKCQKEMEHSEFVRRELELKHSECMKNMNVVEAEILKLEHSNGVTDAKLMKIVEQKNSLEERITTLEDELKEKVCNEEKLHQDLIALQSALNKQVALALTTEEQKTYHEHLKLAAEQEKARTQSVIRSLQSEVERLNNENESAKSLASSLKCETQSLSRRLDNSSMDLDIKNETILMMETTLGSLNSKVSLLEAEVKEKDLVITAAKTDLSNTKVALDKYREEFQRRLNSRVDELTAVIQQKDAELSKLREENESKCERISKMAEELLQVAQTFNIEKTSLIDHAKNLEDMLECSTSTEKQLQNKIEALSKQLEVKENKFSRLHEKLTLTIELHNCEKRELTTKNEFLKRQLDESKLKCDRLVKDFEESNGEHLKGRISMLEAESQELKDELKLKTKDIQRYEHELEVLQKSARNTIKVNAQLEEEVKSLTRSKKQEVDRLEKEIAILTEKIKRHEPHASDISTKLRQEYEDKLERLKAKMRKIYTDKVERMMKYQTGEEKMFADEELQREKQKRISLESMVRKLSDELLIIQEEKRALISNNIFRTPAYPLALSNPAYESPPLQKTHSLDRLPTTRHGLDNLGADFSLDQSFSSRRTSTSSNRSNHVPRGIGKVFPAADEDGEVFDNRCLADLKEGICTLAPGPDGVDRMSILQQRNSMCPPHLKSSYPVESQFFAPNAKEDEIKVTARGNKENQPQEPRSVPGTPSKLRSLFSGRRKH